MRLCLAVLAAMVLIRSAEAQTGSVAVDVLHYDATVEPDVTDRSVKGRVRIDFTQAAPGPVEFDIGGLSIDSVTEQDADTPFTQGGRKLRVDASGRGLARRTRSIEIRYHGVPRFGLTFVPERSQTYTIFSTDQWMPCINAPSDRATLLLTLIVPKDLVTVANGKEQSKTTSPDGRTRHVWRLDQPAPTFSFGFAAARFNEARVMHSRIGLRFLSSEALAADLLRIFADTGDMIAFFEDRAGVRYPAERYTQALVQDTAGQEMSTFALMSDEYGQGVLADPQRVGLIAHELAHQWWGIGVTCEEWTHFWLNEGFATFMAAAYREKRFGRDAYLKDVEGWRIRYEKIKAAGKDRSLAFPDWNRPTSDDRALVYQKGALVLDALRQRLGERTFWKGLRDYTRASFGKSVTTSDFEKALEKSTGRDLKTFFSEWVYLAGTP